MAKWGEGEARWIVEHRDDGRNINGWHWEEKNMLGWVKQRVEEHLKAPEWSLELTDGSAKIDSLKEIKGEASVSRRKGTKIFAMYDLTLTLKWSGLHDGKDLAGEVKVTEFASANDEDEFVVTVSVEGTGKSQTKMKGEVEKKLSPRVLEKLKAIMGDMIPFYQQQHLANSSSTGSLGGLERPAGSGGVPQEAGA